MGDRGQVLIKDVGVYLYTHWEASGLLEVVSAALSKRWRWDDPEYLARIIFCEMVDGKEKRETGFGIGTSRHGDVRRVVVVNCENEEVTVEENDEVVFKGSFVEVARQLGMKEIGGDTGIDADLRTEKGGM